MDDSVHYLARPQGRIAYSLQGAGPLVVALPGMGDLRASYRELVPPLVDAGYRVAVMDLRGQGDSDIGFTVLGDIGNATDLIALIDELGGPAIVLGNSMGAAAAAWAAAERPDAVTGLVFYGPLLRNPASTVVTRFALRLLYRVALAGPWGARFWAGFYRSLNKGTQAPWLAEHSEAIAANLREPGRLRSFRQLALQLDHAPVEARVAELRAPVLSFIGALDPDYGDPQVESTWLAALGRSGIVPDSGHYPHAQRPDMVVPATIAFLGELTNA